jgi:hypothetical protein
LAFGELGDFWGILKVSYNIAVSVKYSKNMRISASQNMFLPIFQVIVARSTHIGTGTEENLPHFWGILGDF